MKYRRFLFYKQLQIFGFRLELLRGFLVFSLKVAFKLLSIILAVMFHRYQHQNHPNLSVILVLIVLLNDLSWILLRGAIEITMESFLRPILVRQMDLSSHPYAILNKDDRIWSHFLFCPLQNCLAVAQFARIFQPQSLATELLIK